MTVHFLDTDKFRQSLQSSEALNYLADNNMKALYMVDYFLSKTDLEFKILYTLPQKFLLRHHVSSMNLKQSSQDKHLML